MPKRKYSRDRYDIIDKFSLRSEENKIIDEEIEILKKEIDVLGIIK